MKKEDKDFLILEIAKSGLIKKDGLIYSGDLKEFIDQLEETEEEKPLTLQQFEKWYSEIKDFWKNPETYKSFAIKCISQLGFGHNLENSKGESVAYTYQKLSWDMQDNKERYIRMILDDC